MCLTAALTFMNTPTDHFLIALDDAIRTVFAHQHASRANPADKEVDASLTAQEKKLSSALMRVNHVGEVSPKLFTAHKPWPPTTPN